MPRDSAPSDINEICAIIASYTGINAIAIEAAVMILNIVSAFFATLANGLVIIVYYRNRRLRTHQAMIFFLLAITDFSITAFVQPMYVVIIWKSLFGSNDCVLSIVVGVLSMLFLELSLIMIVILSLHTYLTLAYPYRRQNMITTSRLKTVIVLSWILILLKNLGIFLNYKHIMRISIAISCSAIVVVVVIWCWTYKLVVRHQKTIHTTNAASNKQNVPRRKILRSTITALAIVASLIACYSLSLCFTIFESLLNLAKLGRNTHEILLSVAMTLMYFNSLLNPCLVFWRNSGFREAVKSIFSHTIM